MLQELKLKSIALRKQGFSYSEILKEVPVAKSTLSLWLRSVDLAKVQKRRLTQKKLAAALKGSKKRKEQRILKEKMIKQNAKEEIINRNNYLLSLGAMLYWAEGSKTKSYRPTQNVIFSNSDPIMIKFFLKWLNASIKIPKERIVFDIYIHVNYSDELDQVKQYWSDVTGFSPSNFDKIYFKKHTIRSNRKNNGSNYYGLLRVKIKRSTDLNRKITGWIDGICQKCGVV